MNKNYSLFFVAFSILFINWISGFAQTTFVLRTGSVHSDFGISCSPTLDQGIIVAQEGSTNGMDIHSGLVKIDALGNMQWYKLYQVGAYTLPCTVLQSKDEGYIVLASGADSSQLNYNHSFLTLYKTDANGTTLWNKQYSLSNNDLPLNLVIRKVGGYISFSVSDYNLGSYPGTVVTVFEDNGDTVWSKKFMCQYGLKGTKGIEMPNGNICFIATAGDPQNSFFLDVIVTMIDANGNLIWSKNFGTYYDDEAYALAANSSNDIFITGRSVFTTRNWDGFILKLDQNGNKLMSNVFDGGTSEGEIMRCIIAEDNGRFSLLGDMGTFSERDITLINLNSSGHVVSTKRYPFSPLFTNYPYDLFRASDGGLVFTGDYRPPLAVRDAIIVKAEPDGSLNCFTTSANISEYNEIYHDTIFNVTSSNVHPVSKTFPDSVPVNPFTAHVVCALSTDIGEPNAILTNHIEVFPNPSPGNFTLKITEDERLKEVNIYSSDSKKVFSQTMSIAANEFNIDMNNFANGIYFVECLFDSKSMKLKFIKY